MHPGRKHRRERQSVCILNGRFFYCASVSLPLPGCPLFPENGGRMLFPGIGGRMLPVKPAARTGRTLYSSPRRRSLQSWKGLWPLQNLSGPQRSVCKPRFPSPPPWRRCVPPHHIPPHSNTHRPAPDPPNIPCRCQRHVGPGVSFSGAGARRRCIHSSIHTSSSSNLR